MPTIVLNKRSGQSSPLSTIEVDDNWSMIEAAINSITEGLGNGTVTSVAMSVPSIMSISGSPITTSGTLALTLAEQNANKVLSGPTTGSDATPTFRTLVAADLPTVPTTKGGTGTTSFTASRVILSNSGGTALEVANVTATELSYLENVTSDIQAQIDSKQATITTLAVNKGGTGATTAQGARISLLPSIGGNALKYLRVNAGATDYELATLSNPVTSVNSLVGALTLTKGNSGTDLNITSVGTTITINLPDASASARGAITTSAQTIAGQKTFSDAPILGSVTDTAILYNNAGEVVSSPNYVVNDTKEQVEFKRISVTERQIALGYNPTFKTANYAIDNTTDHIIYCDAAGGSFAVDLPDSVDPNSELGTIYRIVKPIASNNVTLRTTGSDTYSDGVTTSVAIVGVSGWIDVQLIKSGRYAILSSKLT